MLPVEIFPVQDSIVLRARGSELLILPHHVRRLKGMTQSRDFSVYFRDEALVNRPARKLFEAWLRKDQTLWPRLYKLVHKELTLAPEEGDPVDTSLDSPGSAPVDAPSKSTPVAETSAPLAASTAKLAEAETTTEEPPKAKKPARKATTKKAEPDESSAKSKEASTQSTAAKDKKSVTKKTGESQASKAAPKKAAASAKPKSAAGGDAPKGAKKGTKKSTKKGAED